MINVKAMIYVGSFNSLLATMPTRVESGLPDWVQAEAIKRGYVEWLVLGTCSCPGLVLLKTNTSVHLEPVVMVIVCWE